MFSCWIVTNVTSARGTLHYRKTRIPSGYQLVICGQYKSESVLSCVRRRENEKMNLEQLQVVLPEVTPP
jgi:hypothetical protein